MLMVSPEFSSVVEFGDMFVPLLLADTNEIVSRGSTSKALLSRLMPELKGELSRAKKKLGGMIGLSLTPFTVTDNVVVAVPPLPSVTV